MRGLSSEEARETDNARAVNPDDARAGVETFSRPDHQDVRLAPPVRVSVIAPVKNEEASIEKLLHGLVEQSYTPSEIVVTDGGSNDRTREIIRAFQKSSPVPVVLVETAHAFPGKGRNLAIARATHEWVACIDGGVVPHRDWLQELVRAARSEPGVRVVYGRYEPVTDTYFTKCAAITYVPPPGQLTPFIASSLLHRSAWQVAGGFREDLRSGEDLLFFQALADAHVPTVFGPDAVVYWSLQPSLKGTFRRFSTYSRYGMKAGLGHQWQLGVARFYALLLLIVAVSFLWSWLLLLVPLLLIARAERRIYSWYRLSPPARRLREMLDPRRALSVAAINVLIDVAMFKGVWDWLRLDYKKPQPHQA